MIIYKAEKTSVDDEGGAAHLTYALSAYKLCGDCETRVCSVPDVSTDCGYAYRLAALFTGIQLSPRKLNDAVELALDN